MDVKLLQNFLEQAERYLPTIRGGILVCAQEGNSYGALNASLRQVGLIKDSALNTNFTELAQTAAALEENLKEHIGNNQPLADAQTRELLDQLTKLEISLAQMRFEIEEFPFNVADFVEESFDNLRLNLSDEKIAEPVEAEEEIFEMDEEMLEIFSLEAEELVQSIGANLKILEKNPSSRETLLEIRRNAHTLKGSAGIVGLKRLSEAAHKVEDLLDYLAENEIAADKKIFELILTSTDCFSALASGENSSRLTKKIARLYKNFDGVIASLREKPLKFPQYPN